MLDIEALKAIIHPSKDYFIPELVELDEHISEPVTAMLIIGTLQDNDDYDIVRASIYAGIQWGIAYCAATVESPLADWERELLTSVKSQIPEGGNSGTRNRDPRTQVCFEISKARAVQLIRTAIADEETGLREHVAIVNAIREYQFK